MEKSKRPVIDSDTSSKEEKRERGGGREKCVGGRRSREGRRSSRRIQQVSLDPCNADGENSVPTSSDRESCFCSFEPLQLEELFLQHKPACPNDRPSLAFIFHFSVSQYLGHTLCFSASLGAWFPFFVASSFIMYQSA